MNGLSGGVLRLIKNGIGILPFDDFLMMDDRSSWRSSLDGQHVAWRVFEHVLGNASQESVGDTGQSVRSDDEQIRIQTINLPVDDKLRCALLRYMLKFGWLRFQVSQKSLHLTLNLFLEADLVTFTGLVWSALTGEEPAEWHIVGVHEMEHALWHKLAGKFDRPF